MGRPLGVRIISSRQTSHAVGWCHPRARDWGGGGEGGRGRRTHEGIKKEG